MQRLYLLLCVLPLLAAQCLSAQDLRTKEQRLYEIQLRQAALDGWFRAAPGDPDLATRLRELAADEIGRAHV